MRTYKRAEVKAITYATPPTSAAPAPTVKDQPPPRARGDSGDSGETRSLRELWIPGLVTFATFYLATAIITWISIAAIQSQQGWEIPILSVLIGSF